MNEEKGIVSILGCGWLGLPLAQYLLSKKYKIKGSTRQETKLQLLKNEGILPFQIDLSQPSVNTQIAEFLDADVLVIAYPPKLRQRSIDEILDEIEHFFASQQRTYPKNWLLISSTSVYGEKTGMLKETDADTSTAIFKIEKHLEVCAEKSGAKLTVLRCGGLMGYDRIPCKYFSGKKGVKEASKPVNYLHQDDAVRIIERIIETNAWGKVYNALSPTHPSRKAILHSCFAKSHYTPCTFADEQDRAFKIIDPSFLIEDLPYRFLFPNPLDFSYSND
ncbi:hypothetical protein LAG90_13440 [Marinilongibacter aquaticus]|uniref:hypothetical protein n=1 Tax=Marinilongibacter aquaticus TaxID=2975157 RepID=UPI0021BD9939|nr:hypothetical protein [Marinilongibacter aquaticus]UBM57810.1 hypothetical protein LAG90_13440 [Marinilongibacter aquaticus]